MCAKAVDRNLQKPVDCLGRNPERIMELFTETRGQSFQLIYLVTRGKHFANPCLLTLFYIGARVPAMLGRQHAPPLVRRPVNSNLRAFRLISGAARAFVSAFVSRLRCGRVVQRLRRKVIRAQKACNVLTMRAHAVTPAGPPARRRRSLPTNSPAHAQPEIRSALHVMTMFGRPHAPSFICPKTPCPSAILATIQ